MKNVVDRSRTVIEYIRLQCEWISMMLPNEKVQTYNVIETKMGHQGVDESYTYSPVQGPVPMEAKHIEMRSINRPGSYRYT